MEESGRAVVVLLATVTVFLQDQIFLRRHAEEPFVWRPKLERSSCKETVFWHAALEKSGPAIKQLQATRRESTTGRSVNQHCILHPSPAVVFCP